MKPNFTAFFRESNKLRQKKTNFFLIALEAAFTLGLLALSVFLLYCSSESLLYYFASQIIFCVVYFRSFSIFHDATHGTISKNNFVNDIFGVFFSVFSFLPFYHWKKVHIKHHQWTGQIDNDQVLGIIKNYSSFHHFKKTILEFCWKHWIPVLAFMQHVLFWKLSIGELKKSENKIEFSITILQLTIYIASTLYYMKSLYLILPSILFYLLLVEVVNFPHHLGLTHFKSNKPTPISLQHEYSRSCIHNLFLSRVILCNFNFHSEHHLFPKLPFIHLRKIHELTSSSIKLNTSQGFQWILQNRKRRLDTIFSSPGNESLKSENLKVA